MLKRIDTEYTRRKARKKKRNTTKISVKEIFIITRKQTFAICLFQC